jgi:hypothetical protein
MLWLSSTTQLLRAKRNHLYLLFDENVQFGAMQNAAVATNMCPTPNLCVAGLMSVTESLIAVQKARVLTLNTCLK